MRRYPEVGFGLEPPGEWRIDHEQSEILSSIRLAWVALLAKKLPVAANLICSFTPGLDAPASGSLDIVKELVPSRYPSVNYLGWKKHLVYVAGLGKIRFTGVDFTWRHGGSTYRSSSGAWVRGERIAWVTLTSAEHGTGLQPLLDTMFGSLRAIPLEGELQ